MNEKKKNATKQQSSNDVWGQRLISQCLKFLPPLLEVVSAKSGIFENEYN